MRKENIIDLPTATEWLQKHAPLLNMSSIARQIDVDLSTLTRAIRNEYDVRGVAVKIPKRCLPALQKMIESFK